MAGQMKLYYIYYHGDWMEDGQEEFTRVYGTSEANATQAFKDQFVRFLPGRAKVTITHIDEQQK